MKEVIFDKLSVSIKDSSIIVEGSFNMYLSASNDDIITIIEGVLREVSKSKNEFGPENVSIDGNWVKGIIRVAGQ